MELPLFKPYNKQLDKNNNAISSTGSSGTGGAITAALFLNRFIDKNTNWAHVDLMAWNTSSRPGFPVGGGYGIKEYCEYDYKILFKKLNFKLIHVINCCVINILISCNYYRVLAE